MRRVAPLVLLLLCCAPLAFAADATPSQPVDWQAWHADNDVSDVASLQRGARDFMSYCSGCHSLQYERYQRMAKDLKIPGAVATADLVLPGSKILGYIKTSMPPADSVEWFGKAPPDLSLITRYQSPDYVYQLLKTFYVDPTRRTGTNDLAYPNIAMPDVLSSLQGVQQAVFRSVTVGSGADAHTEKVFDHFKIIVPGTMTPAQYDGFVRDIVNFLDYVAAPEQTQRRSMGIWVVLFLLGFTGVAWLLKREYWKDVH